MKRTIVLKITPLALAGLSLAANASAAPAPGSLDDWSVQSQATAAGDYVNGPGTPPAGTGSFHMETGPGQATAPTGGKIWLSNSMLDGKLLSEVLELGYSTYIDPSASTNDQLVPSIQFQVDLDGNGTRDSAMVFEPIYSPEQGTGAKGVWKSWNARAGHWWFNTTTSFGAAQSAFPTYDAVLAAYPNAKILQWFAQPSGYGTQIVAGQNSAGAPWSGFSGAVDAFHYKTASADVTYDFDLVPRPFRGGPAGAIPGAVLSRIYPPAINSSATLALRAVFSGQGIPANSMAIVRQRASNQFVAATTDLAAPGAPNAFSRFNDPLLNEAGKVAFTATLKIGSGVDAKSDTGVWSDLGGTLKAALREGSPAVGMASGQVFKAVTWMILGENELFIAAQTGSASTSSKGIWKWDGNTLTKVIALGDEILHAGYLRTVKSFSTQTSTGTGNAQTRLAAGGTLALIVNWQDGRSEVVEF